MNTDKQFALNASFLFLAKRTSSSLFHQLVSGGLTSNQENKSALVLYNKAGYQFNSHYETIYLR